MLIEKKNDLERIEKLPMFFIISRGRSGSNLLRTLFDAHPAISISFLSRFVQYLHPKYKTVKKWDEKLILSFYNDLFLLPRTENFNFDKEKLKGELLAAVKINDNVSFAVLCKIVYLNFNSVFEKGEIKIIGNKGNFFYFMETILELFPNAKFIHLTRDYRDNIYSYLKVDFEPHIVSLLAFRWRFHNKKVVALRKKHPDLIYNIRYEDVVSKPELYMRAMCEFLAVDYNPAMLNFHKRIAEYSKNLPSSELTRHGSLFSGQIHPNNVSEWKKNMSAKHIKLADLVVGSFAEEMGYERADKKGNILLYLFVCLPSIVYGWLELYKMKLLAETYVFQKLGFTAFCRKLFADGFKV